ncbi:MAG: hypothetical protein ACI8S6_001063 [Myxococcota bacterium]|jgi:hypothetical protein
MKAEMLLNELLDADDDQCQEEGRQQLLGLAHTGRLRGAQLSGAQLERLDLSGTDLRGADLSDARLRWCDLSGADLRGANLRGADLSYANLTDADLRDADTEGIRTSCARMGGAMWEGEHPLFGRQRSLLDAWLPDTPSWFRMVPSTPRWQIRNVFGGRHPLGMPLARTGEPGAGRGCADCRSLARDHDGRWRCQRLWDMGARGSGPRRTVFRVRRPWPACILWQRPDDDTP